MKTNKSLLITRPNHDLATTYLFYWSKFVLGEAKKRQIQIFDLKGKKANRKELTSYIKKHKSKLVVFNGHGAEDSITGYNNRVIMKTSKDAKLLSQKIVYARSCDAAKKLGPTSIKKKAIAFIGYKRKFLFGYSPSKISQPLRDGIAKLFLEPSNLVPISLIKGNTVEKSFQKSQKAMWKNFHYMFSSKALQVEREAAPYLWMNRKYQTLLGSKSAKF